MVDETVTKTPASTALSRLTSLLRVGGEHR